MRTDPRIVVAGSRILPRGAAMTLLRFFADIPMESTILLRAPMGPVVPRDFERVANNLAESMGLATELCRPRPTKLRPGRLSIWDRDMTMLAGADLCLCFYDVGQIGDEESGTVALVDKAMGLDVPVYAYAITPDHELLRVGEHDPKDLWASLVPEP